MHVHDILVRGYFLWGVHIGAMRLLVIPMASDYITVDANSWAVKEISDGLPKRVNSDG